MYPPIFATCKAASGVTNLLGNNPLRLYAFGKAPDKPTLPYALFRTITGNPENVLDGVPDIDNWTLQVDVFAATGDAAREAAQAMRNAIEPVAYITSWGPESQDPDTKNYRYQFDVDWVQAR
jgi:hypothetical protein